MKTHIISNSHPGGRVQSARSGRVGFIEKAGFGAGDAACNMLFNPITMFLSFFYTDIFGLAPGVVATIFLVVRFADAVFDPFYGAYIDKTTTRWGRFRPWIIGFAVPFAISCMVMFYTPDLQGHAKVIYAFITYLILSLLYSGVNIPYCSLGGVITTNAQERVSCQQFRFMGAGLASLFCTLTLLPMVAFFGNGNRQIGFFWVITIFAIISLFLFVFCVATTRERITPKSNAGESIFTIIRQITKNDQWVVCVFAMFLDCIPSFVRGAACIYFAKYVMGLNDYYATLFLSTGIVAGILGSYITPFFTNRWCKVQVYQACKAVALAMSVVFFFLPAQNVVMVFGWFFLLSVIHQIGAPILWSFIGDVDDYGDWKTGKRLSGICASGNLFSLKIALAVSGAIVGAVLSVTGYQANVAVQSSSAINGIYALMVWIPVIGYLLSVWLVRTRYILTTAKMKTIEDDLFSTHPE